MKKFILLIVFGSIILNGCTNNNSDQAPQTNINITGNNQSSNNGLTSGNVQYFTDSLQKSYTGYYVTPSTQGVYPALILIHEWWGLNDNIKYLADEFAKQGYVVLAVDMYGLPATTDQNEAMKRATAVRNNLTGGFDNLKSAIEYLKKLPQVDQDKIGSVGWCFGGGWAYEVAKNNIGSKVSVMYYGRFNEHDDLSHMRSQILGHFGEQDRSITVDTVREFQAKLKTLGGNHAVYIYPNAGHSFANQGQAYNDEAAKIAWDRTIQFLKDNLK